MFTQTIRPRIWLLAALALALSALMGTTFFAGSGAAPIAAPAAHPAAVTLEPAGHFGGWLAAIAVPPAGNTIYLGEGSGFTVYDVADKAHPRQVAGLPLDGQFISGMALAGNTAYLVNFAGLRVISLADPLRPALLGSLALADAQGIAAVGNTVYIAGGAAGLRIVDVSNPLSPTLAGSYDTPGYARMVAVAGALAYVADNTSGLQIINVSDPAHPTLVGAYDTPGYARDVQVVGTTAYIADDNTGLQILSVSDPAHPTRVGFYDTPGQAWHVAVAGAHAYIADGDAGLQILDVSNPAHPTLLATVAGDWSADNVALSGSHAYVITVSYADGIPVSRELRVLNVSNPASPAMVGVYERPDAVYDMAVGTDQVPGTSEVPGTWAGASRYAYAISETDFWTLDVTEPAIPRPLGKAALSGSGIHGRVAASGTLAYVAERSFGLEIFDASVPISPTVAGRYALPVGAYAHDVAVHGAYACLVTASGSAAPGSDGWLHIVDVRNPVSPTLAASFDTPGDARRVVVAQTSPPSPPLPLRGTQAVLRGEGSVGSQVIAYVADGPAGLRLVDVSNPRAPVALGSVPPPTNTATVAVFVSGSYAYVGSNAAAGWRLQKVDVTNPLSPTVAAETRAETGKINDLTGDGRRLYIGGSLYVLSQSDLAVLSYLGVPVENVEVLSLPGISAENVEPRVDGNEGYIYLSGASYGSYIWEYAEPASACSVGAIVSPPQAALNGCSVSPASEPCVCGSMQRFELGYRECPDWAFRFFDPPTLVCPDEEATEAIGYFTPKLTLAGAKQSYACASKENLDVPVLDFTLSASLADDWEVAYITLQASGNGNDREGVTRVYLSEGGTLLGTGRYAADNASQTFTFAPIRIRAGQAKSFHVAYDLADLGDCAMPSQEFRVAVAGYDAVPVHYPPGRKQGAASGGVTLGCVLLEAPDAPEPQQVFPAIQPAVNAAAPGMTVWICPGTFHENVDVDRYLSIHSTDGRDVTTVRAANSADHLFKLRAGSTTVRGLTMLGATGGAGVYVAAGVSTILNSRAMGNQYGVFVDHAAEGVVVRHTELTGNSLDGLISRRHATVSDVSAVGNGECGIYAHSILIASDSVARANEGAGFEGGEVVASSIESTNNGGAGIAAIGFVNLIEGRTVIMNNQGPGISGHQGVTGENLQVLKVLNNQGTGILSEMGGIQVSNVEVKGNQGGGILANQGVMVSGDGNIVSDNPGGHGVAGGGGDVFISSIDAVNNGGVGIGGLFVHILERAVVKDNKGNGIDGHDGVSGDNLTVLGNQGTGILSQMGGIQVHNVEVKGNQGGGIHASQVVMIGGDSNIVSDNPGGHGVVGGQDVFISSIDAVNNGGVGIGGLFVHILERAVVKDNKGNGIDGHDGVSGDNLTVLGNQGTGILSEMGDIQVSNVGVEYNGGHGIKAAGRVTAKYGTICHNQGAGIVTGSPPVLELVVLCNNQGGVIIGPVSGLVFGAAGMGDRGLGQVSNPNASADAAGVIGRSAITGNTGDGVRLEMDASLAIRQSNITGNTGYGVNNLAGATVNAAGNWWGDPNGPGGAGPGHGDEITGTVAYVPWLTAPVSVVVGSEDDPVYAARGVTATTSVYVQDWVHPTSTVTITLTDAQGWLHGPLSVTAALTGTGAVVPITFTVPAGAPLAATDRVTVTAVSGSDPAARDTAWFQIVAALLADLAVDKRSDPAVAAPGEPLTYTITVANHGPDPAAQVVLTDTLPLTVTFGSAWSSQGTCQGRGPVVCALGALPPAGAVTVTLVVTPNATGRVENTVVATAGEVDLQPWNNVGWAGTEIRIPPGLIYLPLVLR